MHTIGISGYQIISALMFGKAHEDFGLTPKALLLATSVSCINEPLYFYIRRSDSITKTSDYKKVKKHVYDTLYHFDTLYNFIEDISMNGNNKAIISSYLANSLIRKISALHMKDRRKYIKELKQRKITDLLLPNTFSRKIKKLILKFRLSVVQL